MTLPRHAAPARDSRDGCPPLSVWATAQHDARAQRQGRYLPASMAHPGKMLPAIAATAITRYTAPGNLVADPMCGIGTTLVEAAYLGRDGLGVEYEARWARLAAANIAYARRHGAAGNAEVIQGDARQLRGLLPPGTAGTAALIVTSPPYGPSIHGQVKAEARAGGGKVTKWDNTYGTDPANLASRRLDDLLDGLAEILAAARTLLRARRHRRDHHPAVAAARRAGRLPRRGARHRGRRRADPGRAVRRAAGRAARQHAGPPAVVLPAAEPARGPRPRQAVAPDRARGRAHLPRPRRKPADSGKLKDSQREPKGPVSVAVPSGTRVRGEPARAA